MPDYGHDLRFGTFITPSNANPQAPVALAQLSEQLGFDLATFQDHPYQAAFLDAWTLMSWVADDDELAAAAESSKRAAVAVSPLLASSSPRESLARAVLALSPQCLAASAAAPPIKRPAGDRAAAAAVVCKRCAIVLSDSWACWAISCAVIGFVLTSTSSFCASRASSEAMLAHGARCI